MLLFPARFRNRVGWHRGTEQKRSQGTSVKDWYSHTSARHFIPRAQDKNGHLGIWSEARQFDNLVVSNHLKQDWAWIENGT